MIMGELLSLKVPKQSGNGRNREPFAGGPHGHLVVIDKPNLTQDHHKCISIPRAGELLEIFPMALHRCRTGCLYNVITSSRDLPILQGGGLLRFTMLTEQGYSIINQCSRKMTSPVNY